MKTKNSHTESQSIYKIIFVYTNNNRYINIEKPNQIKIYIKHKYYKRKTLGANHKTKYIKQLSNSVCTKLFQRKRYKADKEVKKLYNGILG